MTCGIYKIQNLVNGKVYIGQSTHIERRWVAHKTVMFKKDYPLYIAMRKYGIDNFSFSILEVVNMGELNKREIFWMGEFKSTKNNYGYNISTREKSLVTFRKLSEEKLSILVDKLANTNQTYESLSKEFGLGIDTISEINQGKSLIDSSIEYPIRKRAKAKIYNCIDCGIVVTHGSTRCVSCDAKAQRRICRPSKEELISLIRQHGFVGVGKLFGVSDGAIRKWCKYYSIPSNSKWYK